jgi:hypothetical protein
MTLRPILAPLVGAAICFMMTPRPYAAATNAANAFIAHYAARAVNDDNSDGGRIDIYIERWSPARDREKLVNAMKIGPDKLLDALDSMHLVRAGVLLMPGVQAVGPRVRSPRPRNLYYTQRIDGPSGGQIVVAADQHIGLGHYERWGASEDAEFTLIDIRLGTDGSGIAKAAAPTEVAYNAAAKAFEVKDFAKQPVRLRDVKAEAPDRIVSARYYQPR